MTFPAGMPGRHGFSSRLQTDGWLSQGMTSVSGGNHSGMFRDAEMSQTGRQGWTVEVRFGYVQYNWIWKAGDLYIAFLSCELLVASVTNQWSNLSRPFSRMCYPSERKPSHKSSSLGARLAIIWESKVRQTTSATFLQPGDRRRRFL